MSLQLISLTLFLSDDFQVDVLQSLAKPKKVTVRASDGQYYNLLCKPKVGPYATVSRLCWLSLIYLMMWSITG